MTMYYFDSDLSGIEAGLGDVGLRSRTREMICGFQMIISLMGASTNGAANKSSVIETVFMGD